MKILIVTRSFYPIISPRSFRSTELAKEFARKGHEVTVLTHYNKDKHDPISTETGITFIDLGAQKYGTIEIKGGKVSKLVKRVLRRAMYQLLDYPNIELLWMVRRILPKLQGYDLLITIAVPHSIHWGASFCQVQKSGIAKTWVADCGDPYMGKENDTYRPMFYFKYLEKKFCRNADYIAVPTEGAKSAYYSAFRDKIRVIPQGFDFNIINKEDTPSKNEVIKFAYAGGFIPNIRDPRPIIEYLIKQEKDFEFTLFTRQGKYIEDLIQKSNGRIIVHDFLPRQDLLEALYKMDFLVNIENKGSKQTPSKLIDYAILEKPILSLQSSDLNTDIIDQFLNRNYENSFVVENVDQYRIENVADKFIQLSK